MTSAERAYLAKAASCKISGEGVAAATFSTAQQRARYLQIGLQGTGAYPHFVLGTTWAVATLTCAIASKVSTAIGGKVF